MASWRCSAAGEWIGLPDLSSCRSLDITDTINELNNETSVPSEVVDRFHQEIAEEQELASGDIDQVLQVVDRAIWVETFPMFQVKVEHFFNCICRLRTIGCLCKKIRKIMQTNSPAKPLIFWMTFWEDLFLGLGLSRRRNAKL